MSSLRTKFVQPATDNFDHVVLFLQTVKLNILLSQNVGNAISGNAISDILEFQNVPWGMSIEIIDIDIYVYYSIDNISMI